MIFLVMCADGKGLWDLSSCGGLVIYKWRRSCSWVGKRKEMFARLWIEDVQKENGEWLVRVMGKVALCWPLLQKK